MSELIQFTKGMVDAQDALNSNFNTLENMISGGSEMATKQELNDFKTEVNNSIKKVSKPTTIVIGTSTSNHTNCDLLCDGVEDDVEINQAIQNIAIGGKITILEGLYNITNKISIDKPNITIEGMGKATQFKRMFNTTGGSSSSSVYGGVIEVNSNNVTIDNLFINGNSDSYIAETGNYNVNIYCKKDETTIKNCILSNSSKYGIRTSFCNKFTIENNLIDNNYTGIYCSNSNEFHLLNNKISNSSGNSVCVFTGKKSIISNNLLYNSSSNSLYLYSVENSEINGNIIDKITGSSNASLYLSYCENNNVNNNKISNSENIGIYINNSNNNTFNGNNILETKSYGLNLYQNSIGNSVSGNTLYNTSGVVLDSGVTQSLIASNVIRCGTGTSSDYTGKYTICIKSGSTKNLIVGNIMSGKNYTNSGSSTNMFANNKY